MLKLHGIIKIAGAVSEKYERNIAARNTLEYSSLKVKILNLIVINLRGIIRISPNIDRTLSTKG
jgi:hypothetical protein